MMLLGTITTTGFLCIILSLLLRMPVKPVGALTAPLSPFTTEYKAKSRLPTMLQSTSKSETEEEEVDVIVVGAGLGGLSCAALSSLYGMKTVCLEAHDTPGGVAHSFARYSSASKTVPFRFDSGPSLISGLSSKSTNPLRQVLDAVGTTEDIVWKQYDGWVIHDYADGKSFKLTTGDGGGFVL